MTGKQARRSLGDLEARVMKVVWKRGQATVREVLGDLPGRRKLAYTTILTTLRNLEQKSEDPSIRREMGRAMLVGLEFLVAGDIIRTVVVIDTITDVASLGLVVVIRTVLVFTIHLEVEGHWPWQGRPAFIEGTDRPLPLLYVLNGGETVAKTMRAKG